MTKKELALLDEVLNMPKSEWTKMNKSAPWQGSLYKVVKNGYSFCISYKIPIAMKTPKGEFVRLWYGYSKTSMGHLSSWCIDEKLPIVNGKKWDALVIGRKYSAEKIEKI